MAAQGESSTNPLADLFSLFSGVEQLNIIFIPKEFQPAAETFDDRYLFVGPSILPRYEAPNFPLDQLNSDWPLLYISLGTVANNQLEFYKLCFEAFGDQPWQVVLSVGKRIDLAPGDRLDLPAGTAHSAQVGPDGVTCLEAHRLD